VRHYSEDSIAGPLDVLEGDSVRIAVLRHGAEMVSLQARDASGGWRSFLYRNGEVHKPAEGWGNHATLMGYFLHRLVDERSTYRGHEIHAGNHGFLRHFNFAAPAFDEDSLVYSVPANEVPPEAYPFPVGPKIAYRFTGPKLSINFRFTNEMADKPAHVSFGLHPGFGVSSIDSFCLNFPAGKYVRHFAPGNFLDGRTEVIDHPGGECPFPRGELPGSFLIELSQVPEPIFTLEDSGRRVRLDFSGVPYMTLWSDLGPFICVEPCWGLPDHLPPRPFDEKLGIQVIPAGGTLEAGLSLTAECL